MKCLIEADHLQTVMEGVGGSNVDHVIDIRTKTIQNILSNFIPYQAITTDDKNPPWFNTKTKSLLQEKNKI